MLQNLINLFKTGSKNPAVDGGNIVSNESNWYSDRYESAITQRNILIILLLFSFLAVVGSVIAVGKISTSKSFSPFVIQIEERTGAAKVVNPSNSNLLSGNESLNRYFIKKYLTARETYNPVDFELNVKRVVRLFSAQGVYRDFISYITNPAYDPSIIYSQSNTTSIKVKSFSKLGEQYFVRFSINEISSQKRSFDKIATLTINYVAMELSDDDRDINPVGFQVTGYRVDDDNS
jgi:type IV secretion system protein VirB8